MIPPDAETLLPNALLIVAAIEVFPPVSELIDEANAYHLWVFPPGTLLPFTLARRPAP